MRILIVGNGHTRIDEYGNFIFDHETAKLLTQISQKHYDVLFAEPFLEKTDNSGLNNFTLCNSELKILDLKKFNLIKIIKIMFEILFCDFVYLFFPGKWSSLIGLIRRYSGKPYGLYIRGERFNHNKSDIKLIENAKFICTVIGLKNKLINYNSNIITIRPMIDFNISDSYNRKFETKEKINLNILFVGRIEAAKGVPELIKAANLLKSKDFSFNLKLAGQGQLFESIGSFISKNELSNVTLLGLISDPSELSRHYEWADLLILPTHHEGFPRVLLEAMLKKCAIACTMVGGIPSIMVDGKNCVSLQVGNSDIIAQKLEMLKKQPELLNMLANEGYNTAINIIINYPEHINIIDQKFRELNENII